MKIPCHFLAAFTDSPFGGNPAGVCVLERWPADIVLKKIAANNNLPETAFVVPKGNDFDLRWFTPAEVEIDLCGHATLAAAKVLFSEPTFAGDVVRFHSRSGVLEVSRNGEILTLNFPARPATPCAMPAELVRGLGARPVAVFKARDYLAVFENAAAVRTLQPDFDVLKTLDAFGIIVTAPDDGCDFVSRFFVPKAGVNEDPVTGSAHCTLIPYWSQRLGKTKLHARQVSARGGELFCEAAGDRVCIGGKAVLYLRGEIVLDDAAIAHQK